MYSNIRREREEGGEEGGERRGESSWVFGIVREPVPCSFDSLDARRAQSVGDSGAPLFTPHHSLSRPVTGRQLITSTDVLFLKPTRFIL